MRNLIQEEEAKNYLAKEWLEMRFSHDRRFVFDKKTNPGYDAFVPDMPYIYDLAKQDVLPTDARDEMYRLLRNMVPLFGALDGSDR